MVELSISHLSDEAVAAFADGALTTGAQARAAKHIAGCLECSAAIRIQRETTAALRSAMAPVMSSQLLDRLRSVPMSAPLSTTSVVLSPQGHPMFPAYRSKPADPQPAPARPVKSDDREVAAALDVRTYPTVRHMARTVSLAGAFTVVALGVLGAGVSHASTASPVPSPRTEPTAFTTTASVTNGQAVRLTRPVSVDHALSGR
jgi:hypothetical protein